MKLKKWFSEHIDKKRLKRTVIYGVLTLVLYQGYLHLKIFQPSHEYTRQFTGIAATVSGIIAVVSFFKMFRGGLTHVVAEYLGKAFSRLTGLAQLAAAKIRKILGLPERGSRKNGRASDERSFFFGERRNVKNAVRGDNITKRKWKDLTSDTERLRFMFVRFVKKNAKKGKKYSVFSTPMENGASWALGEEDGGNIFGSYTEARYGDGNFALEPDKMKKYAEISGVKQ